MSLNFKRPVFWVWESLLAHMHFLQLKSKPQELALKLLWQLSPNAVLLPIQSSSSESLSIIPHCIFNNGISTFFQAFLGFSLQRILVRIHLATVETSYLSRGQELNMQAAALCELGDQPLCLKNEKAFKALLKRKKNPNPNPYAEHGLNFPTGVQRKKLHRAPERLKLV